MRYVVLTAMLAVFAGAAFADEDPKKEFEQRFKDLKKKDVQGHMELVHFCLEHDLLTEAEQTVRRALESSPNDQGLKGILENVLKRQKEKASGGGRRPGEGEFGPPGGKPGGKAGGDGPQPGAPVGDPGLTPKTPKMLGGDPKRIKAYVDQVFAYGRQKYDAGDVATARKYWDIILKHYAEAGDKVEIINALLSKSRATNEDKPPKPGKTDEFGQPPTFDDEESRPARVPKPGNNGNKPSGDRVPKPTGETVPKPTGDDVPKPAGGNVPKPGGENVPKPPAEEVPKPPITGRDPDALPEGPKDPKDPAPAPAVEDDPDAEAKKDAEKYKKHFTIKSFRRGSNSTFGGSYPELQLVFENTDAPKYVTLVFYAYSKDGKVFKAYRTVFGPDKNTKHAIVAAYKKEWVPEFGNLAAGRVEICAGTRLNHAVMHALECDTDKAPKDWWKVEDPQDFMGFYGPGQNPFETNTLKAVKR